nr:ER membrane protein complex subunit 2 isoform X2 [Oryctolagus cuniculus]
MAKISELYDVTWEEMRDKMRKWREENSRNSEQIVEVGEELINEYASKLGDDIWIIYEQVMIAALDYGRDELALFCLQELRRQFPGSHRVKRLTGMRFEAMERYDDAIQLYDRILQEDPTNTAARKRKIAIRKAQGKNVEAIRELNEYLEQFVGDQEAWHELAELYINEHDYAKAAFCLEELMMTNPHNHLYCQQYAEVKYTQGGLENLELSRKYFAQALKLNNRNMRALFGLYMSASHIASNAKASAKMKKDNMKYASWAASQINRAYQSSIIWVTKETHNRLLRYDVKNRKGKECEDRKGSRRKGIGRFDAYLGNGNFKYSRCTKDYSKSIWHVSCTW